jgi:hypothetical protein
MNVVTHNDRFMMSATTIYDEFVALACYTAILTRLTTRTQACDQDDERMLYARSEVRGPFLISSARGFRARVSSATRSGLIPS